MQIDEAIELLKKTRKWILEAGGVVCPHKYGMCKHDNENCPVYCIDQALAKLREIPKPKEFTKRIRKFVKMYENEVPRRAEITFLGEACDIIEQQAEIRKSIIACNKLTADANDKCIKQLQADLEKKEPKFCICCEEITEENAHLHRNCGK